MQYQTSEANTDEIQPQPLLHTVSYLVDVALHSLIYFVQVLHLPNGVLQVLPTTRNKVRTGRLMGTECTARRRVGPNYHRRAFLSDYSSPREAIWTPLLNSFVLFFCILHLTIHSATLCRVHSIYQFIAVYLVRTLA